MEEDKIHSEDKRFEVTEESVPETVREKLPRLPTRPGVYQYKNAEVKIIYVGKAKNLRNRVRSYFQEGRPVDAKTKALVKKITDLEVIVTDSEAEALILEDTLIKKFRPKYNIMLKDDKTYPYVRVTNEQFPKIFVTRTVVRDGPRQPGCEAHR
jgi:excinuclease ABC subunit C